MKVSAASQVTFLLGSLYLRAAECFLQCVHESLGPTFLYRLFLLLYVLAGILWGNSGVLFKWI